MSRDKTKKIFPEIRKPADLFGKLYGMASTHQATELNRHLYIDGRVKSDCKTLYYTVDLIHKAKMNGISYFEVSAKNHHEPADKRDALLWRAI